jgi:hypothetical protein
MKRLRNIVIILIALLTQACDNCNTKYRPEIGIGYVFMYDTNNNISYPVKGAKITVSNSYRAGGLKGTYKRVAFETYATDAEGRYQIRFIEKGCSNGEDVYCNLYGISCENKTFFGFYTEKIEINVQNNIFMLDTIKLYE